MKKISGLLCLFLLLPLLGGCFYARTESRDQIYRFMPPEATLREFFEISIPKESIKEYLYKKKNSSDVRVQAKAVLTAEAWEALQTEMEACGYELLPPEEEGEHYVPDYSDDWPKNCDWWDVDGELADCYHAVGGLSMCKCLPDRFVYVQTEGEDVALYFAYWH